FEHPVARAYHVPRQRILIYPVPLPDSEHTSCQKLERTVYVVLDHAGRPDEVVVEPALDGRQNLVICYHAVELCELLAVNLAVPVQHLSGIVHEHSTEAIPFVHVRGHLELTFGRKIL